MENNKIYNTRVLPLVRYVQKEKNGKKYTDAIENLTKEELASNGDKARMLWDMGDELYIAEMPLAYKGGTSIKSSIVFMYDELPLELQEKYFDRTVVLPLTRETVTKIYGERSKTVFPTKTKRR